MNLCSLRCNPTLPSVVKSDAGCLDTSDVGCLIHVCVPCHFDQMRAAPVVHRSALRTGRCCCWPSQMGKCSKAGSNRDAPRLCDKGLCGTCCQQQCSEKALGNRGAARGCPGKPEELKWHFAWWGYQVRERMHATSRCCEVHGDRKDSSTYSL